MKNEYFLLLATVTCGCGFPMGEPSQCVFIEFQHDDGGIASFSGPVEIDASSNRWNMRNVDENVEMSITLPLDLPSPPTGCEISAVLTEDGPSLIVRDGAGNDLLQFAQSTAARADLLIERGPSVGKCLARDEIEENFSVRFRWDDLVETATSDPVDGTLAGRAVRGQILTGGFAPFAYFFSL